MKPQSKLTRWRKRWLGPLIFALAFCTLLVGVVAGVIIYKQEHLPCPPTVWEMIEKDYTLHRKEYYPNGCSYGVDSPSIITLSQPQEATYTADYAGYHNDTGTTVFETSDMTYHVYRALTQTGDDLWPQQLHPRSPYILRCRQVSTGVTVQKTYTDADGSVVEYNYLTICRQGEILPLSANDRFTTIRR